MTTLKVNFIFEGKAANLLPEFVKNYLISEFANRREVFVDLANPMYEKWNEEFNRMYPNVDGYDPRYLDFICEKHRDILTIANKKRIGANMVELRSEVEDDGDIHAYVKRLGVSIYAVLM